MQFGRFSHEDMWSACEKKEKETNIYSTYDCVNQDISYHLIDKTIFWININKVVLRKSQKVWKSSSQKLNKQKGLNECGKNLKIFFKQDLLVLYLLSKIYVVFNTIKLISSAVQTYGYYCSGEQCEPWASCLL